jgi:hypothetical protein
MNRLEEPLNVNHFIVSQVNPHVVHFLADNEQFEPHAQTVKTSGPGWVYSLTKLAKEEISHRMHIISDLRSKHLSQPLLKGQIHFNSEILGRYYYIAKSLVQEFRPDIEKSHAGVYGAGMPLWRTSNLAKAL